MRLDEVPKEAETRLAATEAIVEATHYEMLAIWREEHERRQWEQIGDGWGFTIGECAGMPVAVSVLWNLIDGHLICFYEATSQVVDHGMVKAWMKKMCPNSRGHSDAMNFHNTMLAAERPTNDLTPAAQK